VKETASPIHIRPGVSLEAGKSLRVGESSMHPMKNSVPSFKKLKQKISSEKTLTRRP